jgi:hypothetical protein
VIILITTMKIHIDIMEDNQKLIPVLFGRLVSFFLVSTLKNVTNSFLKKKKRM